jgi:hemerythrin
MYEQELVKWSNTYVSHVKIVDEQHQELFKLTNTLFQHCVGDLVAEKEFFKSVIHQAIDYVKIHFATEEKMMKATKYSGYDEHKREHDSFVLTVVDAVRSFNETGKLNLIQFTRFLKDWILTHIAVCDRKYFDYFQKIATRKKDGKLSITKEDLHRVNLKS